MDIKEAVVGAVVTVVIGGTVYTINQADLVNNFADDTGLSQEQAEQYIDDLNEDDFAPFSEIGASYVEEGEELKVMTAEIDCVNFEYEWESAELTCNQGKEQLGKIAEDSILLGRAYEKLDTDEATDEDISNTIALIDLLNSDYDLAIMRVILDELTIDENKKTGSYNKALLESALESDQ